MGTPACQATALETSTRNRAFGPFDHWIEGSFSNPTHTHTHTHTKMSTHTPFAEPGAASAFAPRDALLQGHDTTFATEADAQCGYSSARGVCLMIAQPGFSFCSIHLCPHGCGRKKGSRDADCGQPHNAPAPRKFMSLVDQANTVKTVLGLDPGMPVRPSSDDV